MLRLALLTMSAKRLADLVDRVEHLLTSGPELGLSEELSGTDTLL